MACHTEVVAEFIEAPTKDAQTGSMTLQNSRIPWISIWGIFFGNHGLH
jgi:hypothetical protein